MFKHRIFHLHYDAESKRKIWPELEPLDNSKSERPDWFEFWPIRQFLLANELDDDTWYGFLSPKFGEKFGINGPQFLQVMEQASAHEDVVLMTPHWDLAAYFTNAFEQGDFGTPGLALAAQGFVDALGMGLSLRSLVATSLTTSYSNYLVAKAGYWRDWLALANALHGYSEDSGSLLGHALNQKTRYFSNGILVPMKTFVQERLACLLLETKSYRVGAIDVSHSVGLDRLFTDSLTTPQKLRTCDLLKQQYRLSADPEFLSVYRKLRRSISTTQPVPELG